jgi:hypothetical protein
MATKLDQLIAIVGDMWEHLPTEALDNWRRLLETKGSRYSATLARIEAEIASRP